MLVCFVKSKSSLTNSCFNGFVSRSLYLAVVRQESGLETGKACHKGHETHDGSVKH